MMRWYRRRSRPAPVPPEQVEVLTVTGELVPCEVVFRGWEEDAEGEFAAWQAIPIAREVRRDQVAELRCVMLPGRTQLTFGFERE